MDSPTKRFPRRARKKKKKTQIFINVNKVPQPKPQFKDKNQKFEKVKGEDRNKRPCVCSVEKVNLNSLRDAFRPVLPLLLSSGKKMGQTQQRNREKGLGLSHREILKVHFHSFYAAFSTV